jgi:hypothetical protein
LLCSFINLPVDQYVSAIVKRKEAKLQTRQIETPGQIDATYEDEGIDTAEP